MSSIKKNVDVFSNDADVKGGYAYTLSTSISSNFSNHRTSFAIENMADFKGKRVLDIGCGDGRFTKELLSYGPSELIGIDPAQGAINIAKKKKLEGVEFHCLDLYDLSADTFGIFDIVVLRGVIHHVSDAKRACEVVSQLGRYVVGMEPNGANPVLKLIEKTSRYHIEHEEKSYLPSTIDSYFNSGKARKIEGKLVNLVPLFCPDWMARILKILEPIVERLPLIRLVSCGQYIFKYRTSLE